MYMELDDVLCAIVVIGLPIGTVKTITTHDKMK